MTQPSRRRRSSAGRCWRRGWTCPRSAASRCSRIRPAPSSRSCSRRLSDRCASRRRARPRGATATARHPRRPHRRWDPNRPQHAGRREEALRRALDQPRDVVAFVPAELEGRATRRHLLHLRGQAVRARRRADRDRDGSRGVAHRDRPPRRRPGRAAALALSEGPPADGLRRRQRLLARDPAGLRRGRRRRLSGPARADEEPAAWPRSWRAAPSATRRPSRRRRASPSRAAARCARAAPRAHARSTRAPGPE